MGIKKAERIILGLYEDYFVAFTTQAIVTNTNLYSYPSDIYGNKIRKIIFTDGSQENTHEVTRIKNLADGSFIDIDLTPLTDSVLKWYPVNSLATGRSMQIFPSTCRDGTLHIWYIRNAAQLVDDADITDIDEFSEYVVAYAKVMAALKDKDPTVSDYVLLLKELEEDMRSTLAGMILDEDDFIPVDTGFYEDCN